MQLIEQSNEKVYWYFQDKFLLPPEELSKYNAGDNIDVVKLLMREDNKTVCRYSGIYNEVFNKLEDLQLDYEDATWEQAVKLFMEHFDNAVVDKVSKDKVIITCEFAQECEKRITEITNGKVTKSNYLWQDGYTVPLFDHDYICERSAIDVKYYDSYLLDQKSQQLIYMDNPEINIERSDDNVFKVQIDNLKFELWNRSFDYGPMPSATQKIVCVQHSNNYLEIVVEVSVHYFN